MEKDISIDNHKFVSKHHILSVCFINGIKTKL